MYEPVWPQPPTRLPRLWDSPGKNTGVGCHFLLQSMKVKSESEVTLSCPTLNDPMDFSLPGSSVHGIFQARVLERVVIAFSGWSVCCLFNIYDKECASLAGDRVWFLGWGDTLEEGMATHSSILAERTPWTEEPGGLQSTRWEESDITERLKYTQCKTNNAVFLFCLFCKRKIPLLISFC